MSTNINKKIRTGTKSKLTADRQHVSAGITLPISLRMVKTKMRTVEEIIKAEEQIADRIWLDVLTDCFEDLLVPDALLDTMLAEHQRLQENIMKPNLSLCSRCERDPSCGKLSALRWALGEHWNLMAVRHANSSGSGEGCGRKDAQNDETPKNPRTPGEIIAAHEEVVEQLRYHLGSDGRSQSNNADPLTLLGKLSALRWILGCDWDCVDSELSAIGTRQALV